MEIRRSYVLFLQWDFLYWLDYIFILNQGPDSKHEHNCYPSYKIWFSNSKPTVEMATVYVYVLRYKKCLIYDEIVYNHCMYHTVNSSKWGDPHMRQWTNSALVQLMARHFRRQSTTWPNHDLFTIGILGIVFNAIRVKSQLFSFNETH